MKLWHKITLGVLIAVVLVSCGSLTPRQGWREGLGPVVPHDTFPGDCALCHEGGSWSTIRSDFTFDHEKETGVALLGAHAGASCLLCHNDRGPVKAFADRGCSGCHEDVHRGRQGALCSSCHNEETWRPLQMVAMHNRTRFPLIGAHASAECFTCHEGAQAGNFEGASPRCEGCHSDDLARATSPDHVALGLTADCQRCHTPVGFTPAQFIHPASFPLTAGHGGRSCTECHTTPGVFTGLSTACASCHQQEFNATTSPNHAAAGFSTQCQTCHTTSGWTGANFLHTSRFPLTNAHAGQQCSACHTGGVYTGLSSTCVSCHQQDYSATTNPSHTSAGFGTDCQQCHGTTRWQGAAFTHPASFPLTAGHGGRSCTECHTTPGVYTGLSTACASCHQQEFNATTSPNHAAAGFSTQCQTCHTTSGWTGANFLHTSRFPLTNAHAGQQCSACHTGGVYTGLSSTCVSCHQQDYSATTNPSHTSAGFGTDCQQCHGTTQWQGAAFTHPTSFPLTAGHAGHACAACHTTPGVYTGLTTACASCHQDESNAATNPNHTQAAFGAQCQTCHNTAAFRPSVGWTHVSRFPLTNAHSGRTCTACHASGQYAGLPAACVSCHQQDYNSTTNPNHTSAGFPTTCQQCHGTTQWQGAAFTHPSSFPLTAGHAGHACAACHTTPGVYTGLTTACASCHQDESNAATNPNHTQAAFGAQCQTCHNTAAFRPSVGWTHVSRFPLTNAHSGRTCTACHASGQYAGLPSACVSCHQQDYNSTTNPNHTSAGFPTTCQQCHGTITWSGAVFNHRFPITSGPHRQACAECHRTPNNFTLYSCTHCHEHAQATMASHHSGVRNYQWVSTACVSCHPNGRH
jgi:hypothetical protein